METIDRVAEILLTMDEFSEFLDHETAAIQAANTSLIEKMAERKQFLALHYQRQLRMLFDRRGDIIDLDLTVRKMLMRAFDEFNGKVSNNALALEVAQRATRTVVEMIVSAIRTTQGLGNESAYKGSGSAGAQTATSCVSVAINQVL